LVASTKSRSSSMRRILGILVMVAPFPQRFDS
jgi:hypothetical protein